MTFGYLMIAEQPLTPWILFTLALLLLRFTQHWLEQHMIGLGLLVTGRLDMAIMCYYVIMLPGVFLHELSHWLVAGALNVPATHMALWPERTETGIRLGYVEIEKPDAVRSTLIGIAPFIVGLAVVLALAYNTLGLPAFAEALATADLGVVIPAAQTLVYTPDFWVWLYLLFAVSNSMMPSAADRRDWPVFIAGMVAVGLLLMLVGVAEAILAPLGDPLRDALRMLTAAIAPIIALNMGAIVVTWGAELVLGRLTGRRVRYNAAHPQALSCTSAPEVVQSLLDLPLPVPAPPDAAQPAAPAALRAGFEYDALPDAPDEFG